MYGYFIFNCVFLNLNSFLQNRILKNIFSLDDVSNYYVLNQKEKVCFRFYSGGIFYQFVFLFQKGMFLELNLGTLEDRVVVRHIYVYHYVFEDDWREDGMAVFVKILLSEDASEVYSLMRYLL